MKQIWTCSALVLLGAASCFAGEKGPMFVEGGDPRPEGKKWVAVEQLSDEFSGEKIDLKKWQVEPVGNSFTWIGRPPGLFKAENISVKEGNLCVKVDVLDEPFFGEEGKYTYSGGIVRSLAAGQPGWYYECRMKANATEMSSTFWLLTIGGPDEAQELDIQECVGKTSELTQNWGRGFTNMLHSSAIHWRYFSEPKETKVNGWKSLEEKNSSRYFVYGCWWKSPEELRFYLDGNYMYSITPPSKWDWPAYLHMAIETYDWNPVPEDGGMVASGTEEERTTKYDWVRTWKLGEE